MLTTLLVATLVNRGLPGYTYRDPNILIAPPALNYAAYTPANLVILSVSGGGTEIIVNAAARNAVIKGKSQ